MLIGPWASRAIGGDWITELLKMLTAEEAADAPFAMG